MGTEWVICHPAAFVHLAVQLAYAPWPQMLAPQSMPTDLTLGFFDLPLAGTLFRQTRSRVHVLTQFVPAGTAHHPVRPFQRRRGGKRTSLVHVRRSMCLLEPQKLHSRAAPQPRGAGVQDFWLAVPPYCAVDLLAYWRSCRCWNSGRDCYGQSVPIFLFPSALALLWPWLSSWRLFRWPRCSLLVEVGRTSVRRRRDRVLRHGQSTHTNLASLTLSMQSRGRLDVGEDSWPSSWFKLRPRSDSTS
jgi:hypothetical protein